MFGSKSLNEIRRLFLKDVQALWGNRLEAVLLYGSAATDTFTPGKSDVNFLVVTGDLSPETLRKLQPLTKSWRRNRIATPLIMRRELIQTSLDSYPLEFLTMTAGYRVLHGDDVLDGLEFRKEDVRLQCERELKAKLLLVREAYVDSAGVKLLLHRLISESLPAMNAVFQGLLYLRGRPWKIVGDDLLSAGGEAFDLDVNLFRELWRVKRKSLKPASEETHELLARYILELERLADWADRGGLVDVPAGAGDGG
jgi:predicted nucleotidyltransferase